jgi:hypothetical protein
MERGRILEYIRYIQCNPVIAPTDTSYFIGNYTLRLYVRVVLHVKDFTKNLYEYQERYIQFLRQLCSIPDIKDERQFITKEMINELDTNLLSVVFKHDGKGSSKELFKL